MALKLKSVRADLKRESDGDWMPVPGWEGVSFKVRADTFPAFRAKRDAMLQRLARKHQGSEIPEDELYRTSGELIADHLLLDWKGIAEDDGQEIPFTKEKAAELLTDMAFREVRFAVEGCSARIRAVSAEFVETETKN